MATLTDRGHRFGCENSGVRIHPEHHAAGKLPLAAHLAKFSETPVQARRAPLALGEHTRRVLANALGMSNAQIDALMRQSVT